MNRAWLTLLAFLAFLAWPVTSQAAEVLVRTRLDPADKAVIGQPVDLVVDVLFPGDMPHPPQVSIPDPSGAQILRFETQGVTIRERVGETSYVGQRFTFVVFPRRGGRLATPAPQVTLLDRSGDPAGSAQGAAQRLEVEVPAGLDTSGPVLAARDVALTQVWSPLPGSASLQPGAALVRTIQRKAQGVPALGMEEFNFEAPPGVRVYVDPPLSDDRISRGGVEGTRTDRVTYVFQKSGRYDLPPLVQSWWDMGSLQARHLTAAGIHVEIASASAAGTNVGRSWWTFRTIAAVALAVLVLLAGGIWSANAVLAWRNRYSVSALAARHDLQRCALEGAAPETYRALETWLDRLPAGERAATRRDARLGSCIAQLEASLFGGASPWSRTDGADLARCVKAFSPGLPHTCRSQAILPPLNAASDPS
jgi:hypothetical protein